MKIACCQRLCASTSDRHDVPWCAFAWVAKRLPRARYIQTKICLHLLQDDIAAPTDLGTRIIARDVLVVPGLVDPLQSNFSMTCHANVEGLH